MSDIDNLLNRLTMESNFDSVNNGINSLMDIVQLYKEYMSKCIDLAKKQGNEELSALNREYVIKTVIIFKK